MRVLAATTAGAGHFGPLVPFANACVAAGHDVRVAAAASFAANVEKTGLSHVPLADVPSDVMGAVFARLPQLPREEANVVVIRDVFAGLDAQAVLPGLTAAVRDWRPDLILRESAEYGSYAVADIYGIPHVEVAIGVGKFDEFTYSVIGENLAALGSPNGVDGLRAAIVLTTVPASLDVGWTADRTIQRFQYEPPPAQRGLPEAWGDRDSDLPLVYASFGTVAASMGRFDDVYRWVIDALADMPVRALLTTGEAGDPDSLAPLPPHVHVERFWPQQDVMSAAAAVIAHGGFGTTMTGLAHGVPMVVVPLFSSDQFFNADAVSQAGAGLTVTLGPSVVADLRDALGRVLAEESFRTRAGAIAAEMAALPAPSESVAVLEAAATGR